MPIRYLSGVNVDSNTLVVDAANDRVGIGTASPVSLLNLNNGDAWINVTETLRGLQFGFAGPSHGSYRAAVMGGAESYGGTDSGMLTFHTQNGYVVSAIPPERMRISGTGNVGIGTSVPARKLHVSEAGNGNIALFTNTTDADLNINLSSGVTMLTPSTGILAFGTSSTEKMRITSAGNVGIGTTNPNAKFQIGNGTSNTASSVAILSADGGNAILSALSLVNSRTAANGNGTSIDFHNASNYGSTGRIASVQDSGTNASLRFSVYNSTDDALVERIRLTPEGNVGIGTTTPGSTYSEKLQVLGSSLGRINVTHTTTSDPRQSDILFTENDTITFQVGTVLSNGTYGDQNWLRGVGSLPVTIHTDSLERLRVTSSGNVGIGTTSPAQKLTVDGTAAAYSAIGASDNVRTGLAQYDTSLQAAGVGGQLVLGYKYTNAEDFTEGAIIKMYKENGTSGEFGSGLKFQVRNNGANLSTKLILDPSGNVGIGTTSPSVKLQVVGANSGEGQLYVGNTDVEYTAGVNFTTSGTIRGFVGWRHTYSAAPFNLTGIHL
jgi:hypothetical protein